MICMFIYKIYWIFQLIGKEEWWCQARCLVLVPAGYILYSFDPDPLLDVCAMTHSGSCYTEGKTLGAYTSHLR